MAFFAKQKLYYYKKYKLDIWGFFRNTLQVLNDNTIYKLHKTYKYQKKLNFDLKKTIWGYIKYKNQISVLKKRQTLEDLQRNYEILKKNNIISKFNKIKKYRYKRISQVLVLDNLWNNFIKTTISKRLSNIFNILLEKKSEQIKVFYRRPFIYEPRIPTVTKRKRRVNQQFISLRILKLFLVMYTYKQLKKITYKAKLQSGVFEHNYITIIESKLPSYIYRISLFPTLFESLEFVKSNNVWVNKKYKPFLYYSVKLFDIVGFRPFYKSYIIWSFFKRLRRKAFLFLFPKCIYISLIFIIIILIKRVQKFDIINAFNFDYYRITNYAQ